MIQFVEAYYTRICATALKCPSEPATPTANRGHDGETASTYTAKEKYPSLLVMVKERGKG
jgi:hypothetical protein